MVNLVEAYHRFLNKITQDVPFEPLSKLQIGVSYVEEEEHITWAV